MTRGRKVGGLLPSEQHAPDSCSLTRVPFYPVGLTPEQFAAMGETEYLFAKTLMPKTSKPSSSCGVVPLGNRVVLSPREQPTKGDVIRGGIVIPDSAVKNERGAPGAAYYSATVLAAGPDCKRVRKGMRVVADDRPFRVCVPGDTAADKPLVDVWMTREEHISAILEG